MIRRVLTPFWPVVVVGSLVVAYLVARSPADEPRQVVSDRLEQGSQQAPSFDEPPLYPNPQSSSVAPPVAETAVFPFQQGVAETLPLIQDSAVPNHPPSAPPTAQFPVPRDIQSSEALSEPVDWVVNPYVSQQGQASLDAPPQVAAAIPDFERPPANHDRPVCCQQSTTACQASCCAQTTPVASEHAICCAKWTATAVAPALCCAQVASRTATQEACCAPSGNVQITTQPACCAQSGGAKIATQAACCAQSGNAQITADSHPSHHQLWEALAEALQERAALEARDQVRTEMLPTLIDTAVKNAHLEAKLAVAEEQREVWASLAEQMVVNARLQVQLESAEQRHEFYGEVMEMQQEFLARLNEVNGEKESLARQLEVERQRNEQMAAQIKQLEYRATSYPYATPPAKVARKPVSDEADE